MKKLSFLIDQNDTIKIQKEEEMKQTYYLIDRNDHLNQSKLGRVDLTCNENFFDRSKHLFDEKALKNLTVGFFHKQLRDSKINKEI